MPNDVTKKCPYCAEDILAAAVKCKYCGSKLKPGLTLKVFKIIGITALSFVGIFVALVIYGYHLSRHWAEDEAKIPWAQIGFIASGGEVLVINREKFDLKDCAIHQQADGDAWSAYHIDIKAGGMSPPLEPGDFSDGAHPLNPLQHQIRFISAYCMTDHGKVRSGTEVKQPYAK